MWYFAREAAAAASQAGAREASFDGASAGTGRAAAENYLKAVGRGTVSSFSAQETLASDGSVAVRVQAQVPRVIPLPGLAFTVDVTATRPRERFTTPGAP